MTGTQRLAKVLGVPQTYNWGTQGSASLVAATHQASNPTFTPDPQTPYAELWFGAHPSAPSQVQHGENTTSNLIDWLDESSSKLPYLFKVLSIAKPLSLQLHPDEETAARLHAEDPEHYKDPHSKPEMTIALSDPFEALCGFRKHRVIMMLVESVPGFAKLVRPANAESVDYQSDELEFLKTIMKSLYDASEELVKSAMDEVLAMDAEAVVPVARKDHKLFGNAFSKFMNILKDEDPIETLRSTLRLFRRLHEFFPYDRGCFAAFFLTYVRLRPGEAIFLGPNTIHSYISGNCLEVMQTSDNVIRAGLTDKFTDVSRLLELVSYKGINLPSAMVKPVDVSMKFEGGHSGSLKAMVPPSTDAFRFYLLKLGTGMCVKDLKIPAWSPMMLFASHGTGEIKLDDDEGTATLTAGQCWICDKWSRLSIKNTGQKTEAEDSRDKRLITLNADTIGEEQSRNGVLELVIVMPNLESGRLRRSNKSLKSANSLGASPAVPTDPSGESPAVKDSPPTKLSVEAFPQVASAEADNEVATSELPATEPAPTTTTTTGCEGQKEASATSPPAEATEEPDKEKKKKHRGLGSALRSLASARQLKKPAKAEQPTPTVTVEPPATVEPSAATAAEKTVTEVTDSPEEVEAQPEEAVVATEPTQEPSKVAPAPVVAEKIVPEKEVAAAAAAAVAAETQKQPPKETSVATETVPTQSSEAPTGGEVKQEQRKVTAELIVKEEKPAQTRAVSAPEPKSVESASAEKTAQSPKAVTKPAAVMKAADAAVAPEKPSSVVRPAVVTKSSEAGEKTTSSSVTKSVSASKGSVKERIAQAEASAGGKEEQTKPLGKVAAAAAAFGGRDVAKSTVKQPSSKSGESAAEAESSRGAKSPPAASKTMTPKSVSKRASSSLKRTASGGLSTDVSAAAATAPGSPTEASAPVA